MSQDSELVFARLGAVIVSAAAIVTTTFGLFDGVMVKLMPAIPGASQAVGFVSMCTLVVLLVLMLLIRKRLSTVWQHLWALTAVVCLAGAVWSYVQFADLVRARTYQYPPGAADQRPLVSAPYHEQGKRRAAGMDVATAVSSLGGPVLVNGREMLWTEPSRQAVEGAFLRHYIAISFLMVTALFVAAIAVWRTLAPAGKNTRGRVAASGRTPP
jgi:hypothetical protein